MPDRQTEEPALALARPGPLGSRVKLIDRRPVAFDIRGVVELTEENFLQSIDAHPFAVVDLWAPTNAPSLSFAPVFAAAAARNPDLLFARINVEEQRLIAAQLNIRSVPTLMVFRDNIVVYAKAAVLDAGALDELLAKVRALDMDHVRRKAVTANGAASGAASAQSAPMTPAAMAVPRASAEIDLQSVEAYLRPSLRGPGSALQAVASRLAAGELVVIRDAFEPDFAERMHRGLDRCRTWRLYEGYDEDFHFHHHNLYNAEEYPEDVAWCSKLFDSPSTKAWVQRLSGRPCDGPAEVSASWYLPGDHSLPHNDVAESGANSTRQVAFVWHLAKDWRSEWGGALYWCEKACYLPAAFNTLILFNVGPQSNHFVTQVSPYAMGKRLAINGWWTGQAPTGAPVWRGPDRIRAGSTDIEIY